MRKIMFITHWEFYLVAIRSSIFHPSIQMLLNFVTKASQKCCRIALKFVQLQIYMMKKSWFIFFHPRRLAIGDGATACEPSFHPYVYPYRPSFILLLVGVGTFQSLQPASHIQ